MEPKREARSPTTALTSILIGEYYVYRAPWIKKVYQAWKLWILFSTLINIFSKLYPLSITFHTNILPKTRLPSLRAYWKPKYREVEANSDQTVSIEMAGQRASRTLQGKSSEAGGIEIPYFSEQNINLVWGKLLIYSSMNLRHVPGWISLGHTMCGF